MRAPVKFLSLRTALRNKSSASFNRPCLARIVPMKLSATGKSGLTFRIAVSSFSASISRLSRICAAICSKSWTRSGSCAKAGTTKRHKRDKRHQPNSASFAFLRPLRIVLLVDFSLAFFDRHDPVYADARDLINSAAGPTHLDRINLRPLLETEMQSQIAL